MYLSLVLNVRDLGDILLNLVDEPECMPLGVVFIGAYCVGNVVFIMLHVPHSVVGFELLSLLVLELEGLDLVKYLDAAISTVAASLCRARLSFSLKISLMSCAVE